MRQFYDITTKLKALLEADDAINVVTIGNLSEADLAKQTVGALAHIIPIDVSLNGNTLSFTFTVLAMDLVDVTQTIAKDQTEPFYGTNNLHDVWNTTLQVLNKLHQELTRGDAFSDLYQVIGGVTCEPFMDRFENLWAGYACDFTISMPNNEICIPSGATILDPSALTAVVSGANISLSWTDNSDNETGFRLYRSTNPLTGYSIIATQAGTTYLDTDITADVFYFYKVKAYNSDTTSGFSNIATGYVPSGACDPATVTLGGSTLATVASGGSEAITVQDQNANDITTSASIAAENVVQVPIYNTSSIYKTGQTTSSNANDDGDTERGRGASFLTLDFTNPFGNTNRFTDISGNAFATGLPATEPVLDWSTYSQSNKTVLAYLFSQYSSNTGTQNATSWLSGQPYTEFTKADWYVCNIKELQNVCCYEYTALLNGDPFNIQTAAGGGVWTSTNRPGTSTQYFKKTPNDSRILYDNTTTSDRTMLVRTYTLTELGL